MTKTVGCDRISLALLAGRVSVWGQGHVGVRSTRTARFVYWFLLFLRLSNLVKAEKVPPIDPPESANLESRKSALLNPSQHGTVADFQILRRFPKCVNFPWLNFPHHFYL